ncbi:hypothetical protein [Kitasatospora sp. NPDC057738]|uniref:hypothetical protein n=1 Tax=Kitasatospora sp. NPDC057738 TaxID=3346233 RepID=UPI00367D64CD
MAANAHSLTKSAHPAAIAYHPGDGTIWFVTPDAEFGSFAPSGLFESQLFAPMQTDRKAGTLALADGLAWTYATDAEAGYVVTCTAEGAYTDRKKLEPAHAVAMAVGVNNHGEARVVCTREGRRDLVLADTGKVATSEPHTHPLYGLAIGTKTPATYWLSCPEAKTVVSYDAATGKFDGSPVTLPDDVVPQHLAITETGGDFLWIATQQSTILRHDLHDGSFLPVDTGKVVDRLFPMADGSLWFTMPSADAVGYVLPGRTEAKYVPFDTGTRPSGIAADGHGVLWVGLEGTSEMASLSKYRMTVLSGEYQSVPVGGTFPDRLSVRVTALDGTGHPGATVTFTVRDDQARFPGDKATATATTGADGRATSPPLTARKAGPKPCDVVAEWKDEGLLVPFSGITVRPEAGPVDHVVYLSGAGQSALPGEDFPEPLRVQAVDAFGTPVPKTDVVFRVTDDMVSFGGSATAVVRSGTDGVVESPVLTAGDEAGRAVVEVWATKAAAGVVVHEYVRDLVH